MVNVVKEAIIKHLDNARLLESLYRKDRAGFKRAFNALYPDIRNNVVAAYWHERLNFSGVGPTWGSQREARFTLFAALLSGIVAQLPVLFSWKDEFFYPRNAGFIVFPAIIAYFLQKGTLTIRQSAFVFAVTSVAAAWINVMPAAADSDTLLLSCIHLPVVLWSLLAITFSGGIKNTDRMLSFLRYNGDLLVLCALMVITGGLVSAITGGLFHLIGYDIAEPYFRYVAVPGLAMVPVIATYLIDTNPQLVGKVSPIIARLFCPVVLVILTIYLAVTLHSANNPYQDRNFLLLFNILLLAVMALIFFSVAEASGTHRNLAERGILLLLALVTVVTNGIGLSAILFRISEWGFTPNRTAVLGSNLLILAHLLLVTWRVGQSVSGRTPIADVGRTIVSFLPVYGVWAALVTFVFPLLFRFA